MIAAITQAAWFTAGAAAEFPTCWPCSWVWRGDGLFHLKYRNAACGEHSAGQQMGDWRSLR